MRTRVVLCLFCVLFLGVADNQVLSPLLPAIRSQLGKSSQQMGWLFTGYSLAAGLSVLLWGPLADIFGARRGLIAGLLVFSLGSFVSYFSVTFLLLLSGRVLTGMGASMLSLSTLAYAADFFPYQIRGWAMSSIVSSYFAALILGVPAGSWIAEALGWNAVFGIAGISALAMLLSVIVLLPRSVAQARTSLKELVLVQQVRTYLEFLRTVRTRGALLSSMFASAGTMGFVAFVGVWLHDSFGISGRQIGLVFLVSGAAALLASPFAGSLSDRIGKRLQFVLGNVAMALFLLALPRIGWGAMLFAVFGGVSLAAAFRQGPMEALMTEVTSPGARGSFIAMKNSFSQLGIALAALACGVLFESAGYWAVCLFCAVSNLAAAAGMILMVRGSNL
jgi:predicted MFS family arabinose efflux permease